MTTEVINFFNDGNQKIIIQPTNSMYANNNTMMRYRPDKEKHFRLIVYSMLKHGIIDINKNIIDLGAWIGDNALPWSKIINGTIYAIDPSDNNCNYIEELKKLNNISNIKVIKEVISDKVEVLKYGGTIDHTSFIEGPLGSNERNNELKSTYLDKLYEENIIGQIDFIHLDVEGMEYIVLSGAKKIVETFRPVVNYEIHIDIDKHQHDIYKYLNSQKYICYMIDEILPGCRPDCRNFIALPIERHDKFMATCEYISILVLIHS
jgi:FkbM family methyltransferase